MDSNRAPGQCRGLSRRDFIRQVTATAVGTGALLGAVASARPSKAPGDMGYRMLGKTGISVSEILRDHLAGRTAGNDMHPPLPHHQQHFLFGFWRYILSRMFLQEKGHHPSLLTSSIIMRPSSRLRTLTWRPIEIAAVLILRYLLCTD